MRKPDPKILDEYLAARREAKRIYVGRNGERITAWQALKEQS